MQLPPAQVGAPVDEIDTPALIVELDAFERNLKRLAEFGRARNVRLRPHAKTHKCPAIALKQIALGAVGQCCQKVGEAEVLVRGGVKDVLVSNQVVALPKLRRLASLARDATVALCFDAPGPVEAASRVAVEYGVTLGAMVEIDVGMQRCGVPAGKPARDLARLIAKSPGLEFRGLQAYHGTSQHYPLYSEREQAIAGATRAVRETLDALKEDGIECRFVSGAGTGTYSFEGSGGVWNELQCGSYVFMDTDYARIGSKTSDRYTDFDHSLFVLASVMSVPRPDLAVVDAGLKSMSAEKGPPWVHGRNDIECTGLSDEHGKLKLGPSAEKLKHGDKVWLIPGHCDPTVNLHDWYVGVRDGRVEQLWPIAARGASS